MIKFYTWGIIILWMGIGCACEEEQREERALLEDSLEELHNYQKIQKKLKKEEKKNLEKRKKRIESGDTLALDYETLKDYLPKDIFGYAREGDMVGSYYGMSGSSYSNAEQNYKKNDGHLRITLDDYNGSEAQLAQYTANWIPGLKISNSNEKAGAILFEKMKGWEVYHIKARRAELMLAISDRILLTIIADQQKDMALVKAIAKKMDLETLAKY